MREGGRKLEREMERDRHISAVDIKRFKKCLQWKALREAVHLSRGHIVEREIFVSFLIIKQV